MSNANRNFDYFRLGQSMERIGVSESTARQWAKRPNGPQILRMKDEALSWMRYSEVEAYIENNSEVVKQDLKRQAKRLEQSADDLESELSVD